MTLRDLENKSIVDFRKEPFRYRRRDKNRTIYLEKEKQKTGNKLLFQNIQHNPYAEWHASE